MFKTNNIKILLIFLLFITKPITGFTQNIEVPDSILAEMQKKSILIYDEVYEYKIVYPENYDMRIKYPVFLGISGGLANEDIVNYCYYAWFRSEYFKNYITILPISPKKNFLMDLSDIEILNLLNSFIDYENTIISNWIIAGTSNGGVTAFKFALIKPFLFTGIITMPGAFNFLETPKGWTNYTVVLAYGENDPDWRENSISVAEIIKNVVKKVILFEMKGQGHILSPDYDINEVYKLYFEK